MHSATLHDPADRTTRAVERASRPGSRLSAAAGALPGAALGLGFGALAALRRTKPLHPAGRVGVAELEITSPQPGLGVPLLAARGSHDCIARFSRAFGLPPSWPDVEGLAMRIDDAGADVLLASTGVGRLGRFVFQARSAHKHGSLTTYLPVRTHAGSLLLRTTPLDQSDPPVEWELSVAHAGSAWRPVGILRVTWGEDRSLRFDPVKNVLPGTRQYAFVSMLREPSYQLARRLVPRPRG